MASWEAESKGVWRDSALKRTGSSWTHRQTHVHPGRGKQRHLKRQSFQEDRVVSDTQTNTCPDKWSSLSSGVWVETDILFPFFSLLLFSWESLLMLPELGYRSPELMISLHLPKAGIIGFVPAPPSFLGYHTLKRGNRQCSENWVSQHPPTPAYSLTM